jgi:spore maturation protein CgeB
VAQVRELLQNPRLQKKMVEANYELAEKYYSYEVLHEKLMNLMV